MEGRVIAACGNIIVFDAQNIQQVFYNTFECEEIFILAVHTQYQVWNFIRQQLTVNRNIFVTDFVQGNSTISVVIVFGQNIHHGWNCIGTHDAGVLAQWV